MTNLELQQELKRLHLELLATFPKKTEGKGNPISTIVEYRNKKYEIDYSYTCNNVRKIYKQGDERGYGLPLPSNLPGDDVYNIFTHRQLTKIVSILNSILKGTEIQDGPVLQVVENNKTIPYYSATIRFECEIDAQRIIGVFAKLNNYELDNDKGYMVVLDEYKGQKTIMSNPTAKLSISSEYDINDIKAILLNFDEELPDCHIAIQSLDYAQFDGMRDRRSQFPTDELVEEWSNKLGNLKKVA